MTNAVDEPRMLNVLVDKAAAIRRACGVQRLENAAGSVLIHREDDICDVSTIEASIHDSIHSVHDEEMEHTSHVEDEILSEPSLLMDIPLVSTRQLPPRPYREDETTQRLDVPPGAMCASSPPRSSTPCLGMSTESLEESLFEGEFVSDISSEEEHIPATLPLPASSVTIPIHPHSRRQKTNTIRVGNKHIQKARSMTYLEEIYQHIQSLGRRRRLLLQKTAECDRQLRALQRSLSSSSDMIKHVLHESHPSP